MSREIFHHVNLKVPAILTSLVNVLQLKEVLIVIQIG